MAVDYLTVSRENYTAAESNIRDADTARDVAEFTRLQVLQQAQAALLAQANQLPSLVLKLLG
jgi:flagellin